MRFFVSSHRLHQLSPRTRLLAGLMVGFLLLQAASGIAMQHIHAGWTPDSVQRYYRGAAPPVIAADDELLPAPPPGANTGEIGVGREFATLLDVAHFHLVFMPIVVFLFAHLLAMSPWGTARWAAPLGYGTFLCAGADIVTPFLLRYAPLPELWSWSKLLAFLGLEAGLWIMGLLVLLGLLRVRATAEDRTQRSREAED